MQVYRKNKNYASLTYERWLSKLKLNPLNYRHLYHDMLLVYKLLNSYMNITPSSPGHELSHTSSRRGSFRLNHLNPKLEAIADNFCFRAH